MPPKEPLLLGNLPTLTARAPSLSAPMTAVTAAHLPLASPTSCWALARRRSAEVGKM